jgi:hypothetical protein
MPGFFALAGRLASSSRKVLIKEGAEIISLHSVLFLTKLKEASERVAETANERFHVHCHFEI